MSDTDTLEVAKVGAALLRACQQALWDSSSVGGARSSLSGGATDECKECDKSSDHDVKRIKD